MENNDNPISKLKFLIGAWRTTGTMYDADSANEIAIKGTDTYELVLNDQFILHRVDVLMGSEHATAIEMIGEFNPVDHTYMMRSFDQQGHYTLMQCILEDKNTLKIIGEGMRSTLIFEPGGNTMEATWEKQSKDGTWHQWMRLQLIKPYEIGNKK